MSQRAYQALGLAYDTSFITRVTALENVREYGFAILFYWNRIEALLKALKYYDKIDQDYPEKLTFITNRSWRILKKIDENDSAKYKMILGGAENKANCLMIIRNAIVHSNLTIAQSEYDVQKSASTWFFEELFKNLPIAKLDARNCFLVKKKKIMQRL